MLKPAFLYKDEIEKKFAEMMYTTEYFYYVGYQYGHELPKIEPQDNVRQFAIIEEAKWTSYDNLLIKPEYHYEEYVVGYLTYKIFPDTDSISQFGLFSFVPGNMTVPKDLFEELERLLKRHHRIEWRAVSSNPAVRSYDHFCKKHNGNKVVLHDVTKDLEGNYCDIYMYEIVKEKTI